MMLFDIKRYLPNELLMIADKMSMLNSVEMRVPFLDHRIVEFAARLPVKYKLHGFKTKYLLKEVCKELLPIEILRRRKIGFSAPIGNWFSKDLREDLLRTISTTKLFNHGEIKKLLENNLDETGLKLFSIYTFQIWYNQYIQNDG